MTSYTCERCLGEFLAKPGKGVVRCSLCGGLDVREVGLGAQSVREERIASGLRRMVVRESDDNSVTGRYACVACAREFERASRVGDSPGAVTCARCGSAEVVSISPKAKVLVSRGRPLTGTEIRRAQFVRRGWALRCEADRWCRTFANIARRIGLGPDRVAHYDGIIRNFLSEVDEVQERCLREYESMRA